MTIEQFQKIYELIKESEKLGPLVMGNGLTGTSSDVLVGALQRISKYQKSINDGIYLEIGVYQGLSLISVGKALNDSSVYGIDNFAQNDPESKNKSIFEERVRLNNFKNINLLNLDYEDALGNLKQYIGTKKISTYFIDGPHDYRSQLVCLLLAKKHLSDSAIILIDDSNYRQVRLATRDFIRTNTEFKLLYEAYTSCNPGNLSKENAGNVKLDWGNGINILAYDPNNILETRYPPTLRNRIIYENERWIHGAKYGALAPEAVSLIQAVIDFQPFTALKRLVKVIINKRNVNSDLIGKYNSMNTFSDELPASQVNPALIINKRQDK